MPAQVIICDDDEELSQLLSTALQQHGYEVRCVHDCEGLWPLISARMPDFVLLDISIPHMGGMDAARALKRQFGDRFRIVLISGEPDLVAKASIANADACMQKPIRIDRLVELLRIMK